MDDMVFVEEAHEFRILGGIKLPFQLYHYKEGDEGSLSVPKAVILENM